MAILSVVVLFHLLILIKVIPYENVWGGRLKTDEEMYLFEVISIVLNLALIGIVWLKSRGKREKLVNIILWIFFGIFSLNTIGNLLAVTTFEKYFSIVTLLLAWLLLSLLIKRRQD